MYPLFKLARWQRAQALAGLLCVSLLLAGCGAQDEPAAPPAAAEATVAPTEAAAAPTVAPADTENETEGEAEGEEPDALLPTVTAEGETAEDGEAEPTTVPEAEPDAEATDDDRVAAPTFDPATNQIAFEPFLEGFNQPLFITHAGDESGRLFVVEKGGAIRIIRDGALVEEPFLDISDRLTAGGNEQGLLGLAFPPDFSETGYFFVHYSDPSGNTAISRFQVTPANGDAADPNSEFSVLTQA